MFFYLNIYLMECTAGQKLCSITVILYITPAVAVVMHPKKLKNCISSVSLYKYIKQKIIETTLIKNISSMQLHSHA